MYKGLWDVLFQSPLEKYAGLESQGPVEDWLGFWGISALTSTVAAYAVHKGSIQSTSSLAFVAILIPMVVG